MVQYRRSKAPGGTFFFTVNLRDRSSNYLITHIGHLRESIRSTKQHHPFEIIAFVVLPDHRDWGGVLREGMISLENSPGFRFAASRLAG